LGSRIDANNNIYAADCDFLTSSLIGPMGYNTSTICKISPAGDVTTIEGIQGVTGYLDGVTSVAELGQLDGIAIDRAGTIYVSDETSGTIRRFRGGNISTVAGRNGSTVPYFLSPLPGSIDPVTVIAANDKLFFSNAFSAVIETSTLR
jgi:sugar lactone lactonase YvrE